MAADSSAESVVLDLVRGITDSAFVLNTNREIQEFNRPFASLQKVDRRQLRAIKGAFCRKHVNMEICETNCIVLKCLASGATVRFDEVKGKNSAGEELNLIVSAVPIRDGAGNVVAALEMHRDVTDEARIHEKYKIFLDKEKRAKEELEHLVNERTKELRQAYSDLKRAESQLVHSEKMSSLGQMVAGIAHELNNPINFIYGNVDSVQEYADAFSKSVAEIMKVSESSPELKAAIDGIVEKNDLGYVVDDLLKIVSSIRKGGERAAEIIKGLRSFSRLDEAAVKEVNLHEDIDTTLTLLRNEHKNRITIHKEYGDLPPVKCFSSQLNQVFMNLLYNSMQAIVGEGQIWIRTRDLGDAIQVEIEDTGCGIPDENLKKIFDPFFTTKEVGKGTGLGLSITYGIVERHGGKIDVTSTVGKGSVFRITLPKDLPEPKV